MFTTSVMNVQNYTNTGQHEMYTWSINTDITQWKCGNVISVTRHTQHTQIKKHMEKAHKQNLNNLNEELQS